MMLSRKGREKEARRLQVSIDNGVLAKCDEIEYLGVGNPPLPGSNCWQAFELEKPYRESQEEVSLCPSCPPQNQRVAST